MTTTHRARVQATLAEAAAEHAALLERLSPEIRATLPVDAQGLTGAIDFVAEAAGLSSAQRQALVRPHAVNPAVMHARVFGGAPLTEETLIGSFVEGARVRADALANPTAGTGVRLRRLPGAPPIATGRRPCRPVPPCDGTCANGRVASGARRCVGVHPQRMSRPALLCGTRPRAAESTP